ncbi:hypothetical protein BGX33_003872, partial [Mortierella sp. NVP41]
MNFEPLLPYQQQQQLEQQQTAPPLMGLPQADAAEHSGKRGWIRPYQANPAYSNNPGTVLQVTQLLTVGSDHAARHLGTTVLHFEVLKSDTQQQWIE